MVTYNQVKNPLLEPFLSISGTAVEALESILIYAIKMRASDVHYDPGEADSIVRIRVDGRVEHAGYVPKRIHEEIISRMKILAGSRTDIHAIPQDGRWKADIGDGSYNIRISFMPTYYGENAVMRILSTRVSDDISFSKLGFTPDHVRSMNRALKLTSGLILVTGPTGSGKTTTLHTCLSLKAREQLSIITLEDPIEYEIPSVRQVHIRHTFGVTFASGLRSALRQDPDVIMVGEIRDAETARVAIHTALTGHLVLSTLHTNSALETIPRLVDMGIDHYLLASTLKLIIAQRLVRTMCHDCFSLGCDVCRNSGYIGRSVIAEVCEVDSELKNYINKKESVSSCMALIRSQGFQPMSDDGHEKVEWGITTKEEVMRVLYE